MHSFNVSIFLMKNSTLLYKRANRVQTCAECCCAVTSIVWVIIKYRTGYTYADAVHRLTLLVGLKEQWKNGSTFFFLLPFMLLRSYSTLRTALRNVPRTARFARGLCCCCCFAAVRGTLLAGSEAVPQAIAFPSCAHPPLHALLSLSLSVLSHLFYPW